MHQKLSPEPETLTRCGVYYLEVSQNEGYLFGVPHNKDYGILGKYHLGGSQIATTQALAERVVPWGLDTALLWRYRGFG